MHTFAPGRIDLTKWAHVVALCLHRARTPFFRSKLDWSKQTIGPYRDCSGSGRIRLRSLGLVERSRHDALPSGVNSWLNEFLLCSSHNDFKILQQLAQVCAYLDQTHPSAEGPAGSMSCRIESRSLCSHNSPACVFPLCLFAVEEARRDAARR